jgi:hypothetical protein
MMFKKGKKAKIYMKIQTLVNIQSMKKIRQMRNLKIFALTTVNNIEDSRGNPGSRPWSFQPWKILGSRPWTL